MSQEALTALDVVRGFQGMRALVIGDAMLDCYVDGRASRLCKEGPVPVLEKAAEHSAPGGAANVAVNLRTLGAEVVFVGLVGRDRASEELQAALRDRNVDPDYLIEDPDFTTIRKTRILANDQYVIRVDEGQNQQVGAAVQARMLQVVESVFSQCDLVVVPDYGYGAASDEVIDLLRRLRSTRPIVMAVDAKDVRRFSSAGATVLTPNFTEAWLSTGGQAGSLPCPDPVQAELVGRRLLELTDAQHIAVTLAQDGVMLLDRSGAAHHLPAHPVPHAADVGAGDSFTAAMALALASGAEAVMAAHIGIDAAGIAVTEKRTSTVGHQELLRRVSLDGSAPDLSLKTLAALLDAERYAGKTIVFTNGVFDILHAGHVQLLQRAKRLGDVLVVGVNNDASVRRLKGSSRPINHEADRVALVAALDPVDYALLFEADTPADLIRAIRPHVHVKGGDYTAEKLPEIDAVREVGAAIEILSLVEGRSTTNVIQKIATLVAAGEIERSR